MILINGSGSHPKIMRNVSENIVVSQISGNYEKWKVVRNYAKWEEFNIRLRLENHLKYGIT